MVAPNNESVEFDIRLNARQAIEELKILSTATTTYEKRIQMLRASIQSLSREMAVPFKTISKQFQEADRILSDSGKGSVLFGDKSAEMWKKVGDGSEDASRRVSNSVNTMRIALGILVSTILHNLLQAVTQFFTGAIDQAKQFETTLYRLSNAERQLSLAGLEVSLKGLKDGILDIQKALPIFSKEDVSELIGSLAVSTKELGFNEEQILKLGAAISILNINSSETESLLQTQAKVTNSLISPQAKSIGALGLSFGKAKIEAKAFEMQILSAGQSFADLTEKQKTQIKYQIVLETAGVDSISDIKELRDLIKEAGGDFEALNAYLNSNTAILAQNASAWKDLQTTVGQVLLPFIPAVTSILEFIQGGINMGKILISLWLAFGGAIKEVHVALLSGKIALADFVEYAKFAFEDLRNQWLRAFFPDIPANAPKFLKKLFDSAGVGKFKETPTTPGLPDESQENIKDLAKAQKDADNKITEAMKDARDKRLDIERDYQRKLQDIARNAAQKLADIATNVLRKQEDAQRDYSDKVADINRDTEQRKEDARRDAHRREEEAEQAHQNALRDLQRQYLFDLEEALHERDARQILRLMRQYQMDRQGLQERRDQEREQAQRDLAQKLQDIERDKQIKLEAARRELEEKLRDIQIYAERERADAAIATARALQDARIAHNRALAENREFLNRKLRDIADAMAAEYNITAQGADAIANLLRTYFGPGGIINGIMTQLQGQMNLQNIQNPNGGNPGIGSGYFNPYDIRTRLQQMGFPTGGLAEGGSFLATRPQTISVAEDRPELVTATPLGRPGTDVNKLFLQSGIGDSGGGSQIELELTLSPDLEARLVRKSLNEAANVVMKINRSKS